MQIAPQRYIQTPVFLCFTHTFVLTLRLVLLQYKNKHKEAQAFCVWFLQRVKE